jgi:hypothetical protein
LKVGSRVDAGLEQGLAARVAGPEARGQPVVLGQLQIDDVDPATGGASAIRRARHRRRLEQDGRHRARLAQQEKADLHDVGAGGDVQVVVLGRPPRVRLGEAVERLVDLGEVPGVGQLDDVLAQLGRGRDLCDVGRDQIRQLPGLGLHQQLEAIDAEIGLLAHGYGWTPSAPAFLGDARVQRRAHQPDDDVPARHILEDTVISHAISTRSSTG